MAFGLECYDESGNPVLKITDRITRYGGQFDTGTSAGSMTIPMLSGGTPWINVQDTNPLTNGLTPTVTISGNTVSWSFASSSTYQPRSVRVIYGVY
jgi:hypothetical protein